MPMLLASVKWTFLVCRDILVLTAWLISSRDVQTRFGSFSRISSVLGVNQSSIVCKDCIRNASKVLNSFLDKITILGIYLQFLFMEPSKCSMWLSKDFPNMLISSRYTKHVFHDKRFRTFSVKRSKVVRALHKPNGVTQNCRSPDLSVKAVFCLSSSANSTYQYPVQRANLKKILEPVNVFRVSSILSEG